MLSPLHVVFLSKLSNANTPLQFACESFVSDLEKLDMNLCSRFPINASYALGSGDSRHSLIQLAWNLWQ